MSNKNNDKINLHETEIGKRIIKEVDNADAAITELADALLDMKEKLEEEYDYAKEAYDDKDADDTLKNSEEGYEEFEYTEEGEHLQEQIDEVENMMTEVDELVNRLADICYHESDTFEDPWK